MYFLLGNHSLYEASLFKGVNAWRPRHKLLPCRRLKAEKLVNVAVVLVSLVSYICCDTRHSGEKAAYAIRKLKHVHHSLGYVYTSSGTAAAVADGGQGAYAEVTKQQRDARAP